MYLSFFGLEREPFHITPDPEFLYLSPSHKEAFASVIYGVEKRKGFVTLTGEVGTGKTTILRAYLKRIEDNTAMRPLYLFNSDINFDELVRVLARELAIDATNLSQPELLQRLHEALVDEFSFGRNVILLIDEAQNMPVKTLEGLRMLSNLETNKEKLLQIILVGQPELERKLNSFALRQLRQRIVMHGRLLPLTRHESLAYITHRLNQARAYTAEVFSPGALRELTRRARGNPRVLNILCDNALITAFGEERRPVPARIVRTAWREMNGSSRRRWIPIAAFLTAAIGILALSASLPPVRSMLANALAASTAPGLPLMQSPPSVPPVQPVDAPPPPPLQTASAPPAPVPPLPEETAVAPENAPLPIETEAPLPPPAPVTAATVHVIQPGDCLTNLVRDVYGTCTDTLIAAVQRANPHLPNPNLLRVGDELVFPRIDNPPPATEKHNGGSPPQ